ncbi:MAG: hypothetical protein WA584_02060 [Pyrinomonadaceae bacterium]
MKNYKNCPNCFCVQPQSAKHCNLCRHRFPANIVRENLRIILLTASSTVALVIIAAVFFYLGSVSNQSLAAPPLNLPPQAKTEKLVPVQTEVAQAKTQLILPEKKTVSSDETELSEDVLANDTDDLTLYETTENLPAALQTDEIKRTEYPQIKVNPVDEDISQNTENEPTEEETEESVVSGSSVPNYPAYPSSSPNYTPNYTPGINNSSTESTYVRGYVRKDGTYVAPYYRSKRDSTTLNNWSTKGNINPYTGKRGNRKP